MNKIPTIFQRDENERRYVTTEPTPGCEWVFAGEGTPTRKYDGTCVRYVGGNWWARREVKPGKTPPANYQPISTDEITSKTIGWEPIEQSAFAKFHAEALATIVDQYPIHTPQDGGTYELVGPKVNGNPEKVGEHMLVRHGYCAAVGDDELKSLRRDHSGFGEWLAAHPGWEGIVFHHSDGRMAKIKARDFR
jgi:hypothetical protein